MLNTDIVNHLSNPSKPLISYSENDINQSRKHHHRANRLTTFPKNDTNSYNKPPERYIHKYTESPVSKNNTQQNTEPFYLFVQSLANKETLTGKLVIKDVWTPEQKFKVYKTTNFVKFSSLSKKDSPKISFEVAYDQTNKTLMPVVFKIELAKNTLDAEILYTRYILALDIFLNCDLTFENASYSLKLASLPSQIKNLFKERGKICRKLLFLQEYCYFKYNRVPSTIPSKEVMAIDYAFRVFTEGKFSLHSRDYGLLGIRPNSIDIDKIPIEKPGSLFIEHKKEFKISLFGRSLRLGKFSSSFKRAILHPEHRKLLLNWNKPINLTLIVLNQKIDLNFYDYSTSNSNRGNLRSLKLLDKLKSTLLTLEPEGVVSLLEEPLRRDISSKEATEIVMDWLLFETSLPNCLFPGDATLNQKDNTWRVGIAVGLLGEKIRGMVGDAFVDKTTGRIVEYPPLLELHKKVRLVFPDYQIPDYLNHDDHALNTIKQTNLKDLTNKKYRSMIVINNLISNETEEMVEITIPSWNPKQNVLLSSKIILDAIPNIQLKPNIRLFALVNIRAKSADDLSFSNFELAPEIDYKNWFELTPKVTKDNEPT